MEKLSPNWFAEGLIDSEYKQYILLAYLNNVKAEFEEVLLYPAFSDLIFHYSNLDSFRKNTESLADRFPKNLKGVDKEKFQLQYEPGIEEDPNMRELLDIVEFSIPKFRIYMDEGRELYHFIDDKIEIDPVGLLPLYKNEGYLLLQNTAGAEIRVFEYQISIFEDAKERYRGIHTEYVRSFSYSLLNTFEQIKLSLIRENTKLPNPATFAVQSKVHFSENRTLLPVVKRKFIQKLGKIGF